MRTQRDTEGHRGTPREDTEQMAVHTPRREAPGGTSRPTPWSFSRNKCLLFNPPCVWSFTSTLKNYNNSTFSITTGVVGLVSRCRRDRGVPGTPSQPPHLRVSLQPQHWPGMDPESHGRTDGHGRWCLLVPGVLGHPSFVSLTTLHLWLAMLRVGEPKRDGQILHQNWGGFQAVLISTPLGLDLAQVHTS